MPLTTYPWPYFFLRSTLFPYTINFPFDMIMIVSERHSASSMLWVVMRTVLPVLILRMSFQVRILICASMPVVGSSIMMSFGSPIKLIAKDNLLLMPPENVDTFPFLFSYKETDSRYFLIYCSSEETPFRRQNISAWSAAVSSSQRISN